MSRTTTTMWFLTIGFYNEYYEYQTKPLRGYHDKAYVEAVCDRLMKWQIDHENWKIRQQEYIDAHPQLIALGELSNKFLAARRTLILEWKKENPFTSIARRHDESYFVTETPIKIK
jgi:hypothetical protein